MLKTDKEENGSYHFFNEVYEQAASTNIRQFSNDGVFDYASAVLNDGLILLELHNAINEGDGSRIICCWKFMILYWWHAGHTKYFNEAVQLISAIEALVSQSIAHELIWCHTLKKLSGNICGTLVNITTKL